MPHANHRLPRLRNPLSGRSTLFVGVALVVGVAGAAGLLGPLDTAQANPSTPVALIDH